MADKKYSIDFTMSDGSTESVEFVAPQGEKGENGKTPYVQDGYWYIDGVNTGVKAKGTDGKDGANGLDGKDGENGKDGKDGEDGKDGKDGETPYIKDGYWWIGDVNTNVKAEGTDGEKGEDGKSGVYVGSDTPDTDANVWIDPEGSPTGTAEEWTFTLEDGTTVKKTIAVLG